MAKFYAYKPDKRGEEPTGTQDKMRFELKTLEGAMRRARRELGPKFRLYTYSNFYDDKTFKRLK